MLFLFFPPAHGDESKGLSRGIYTPGDAVLVVFFSIDMVSSRLFTSLEGRPVALCPSVAVGGCQGFAQAA
jgi:hypothetical protein